MKKRVFLIVLDSFGVGEAPDAKRFGDKGSDTLRAISKAQNFNVPTLRKMGIFNIDGIEYEEGVKNPIASYGKAKEVSMGKDTTTGHWEMAGVISKKPFPTYPNGFPNEIIEKFSEETGRKVLCNKPYSGTDVIRDYGEEHIKTGALIVYTSADSVFQIAAHEDVVKLEELYKCCEIARKILVGENAVGRVIARPFTGEYPNFTRTTNRHDFSLVPPRDTMLNFLKDNNFDVISIGKINDIFAGSGVTESTRTTGNTNGMELTMSMLDKNFTGLCFTNLVDFDMLYGHRNDVEGYAKAMSEFDSWLEKFISKLKSDDVVIITADHGCDPSTPSTDHSREYVPIIMYGKNMMPRNLGVRRTFSDIAKTILNNFGIVNDLPGESFGMNTFIN